MTIESALGLHICLQQIESYQNNNLYEEEVFEYDNIKIIVKFTPSDDIIIKEVYVEEVKSKALKEKIQEYLYNKE